jgi:hypothetical protein
MKKCHAAGNPEDYHIMHVNNLWSIDAAAELSSDAEIIQQGGPPSAVGKSKFMQHRLGLSVNCHTGDFVGQYVPCYMKYVLLHQAYGNSEGIICLFE